MLNKLSIFLIEGYVLVTGENRHSGTGKELLNDPRVRSSFLGG